MDRKQFLTEAMYKTAGLVLASNIGGGLIATARPEKKQILTTQSVLPRWRGFNFIDFFNPINRTNNPNGGAAPTPKEYFKWMRDWGFDFVRIPMAYPSYIKYSYEKVNRYIKPDEVLDFDEAALERVDELIENAIEMGMHVSLNIHRAPGFCINAGFHEPYNLWKDQEAKDALYAHWGMWAKRYKYLSHKKLSFDLLNEPCQPEDMNDQLTKKPPVDGMKYREVVEGCQKVILPYNKKRIIIADGNGGGHQVTPELVDLGVAQSCRGYAPFEISHYGASWVYENPDDLPEIEWPGNVNGTYRDKKFLEEFYRPWIELARQGIGVHCGEFGCYNRTPHHIFLAWFEDILSIFREHNIGWGLWEFKGNFGILDSGRTDVDYEDWYGHKLDRKLLSLLQEY